MSTAPSPAAKTERDRIMAILALPAAKSNRAGAEGLAFGSNATPAEAATALAKAADRKAAARKASAESMRRACGLEPIDPKPLSACAISMLKATVQRGTPAERAHAQAKLKKAGL